MSNDLELLHEGFKSEVDELQSILEHVDEFALKTKRAGIVKQLNNIISNLDGCCDSLYSEFENSHQNDYDDLLIKYNTILFLLNEHIDHDEKIYIKLKHGIDVNEWR